jgi:hypothetical protein
LSISIPRGKELQLILIFYFSGGFVLGGSTILEISRGLIYRNIDYFFTKKLGYEVIILGYYLLSDSIKFSSSAEDV